MKKLLGNKYVRLFGGVALAPVLSLVVAIPLIFVTPSPSSDAGNAIYFYLIIAGGYLLLIYIARAALRAVTELQSTTANVIAAFSVTVLCAMPLPLIFENYNSVFYMMVAVTYILLPLLIWVHWSYFGREGWQVIFVSIGLVSLTILVLVSTMFLPDYPLFLWLFDNKILYLFPLLSVLSILMIVESWLANLFLKDMRNSAAAIVAANSAVLLLIIVTVSFIGSIWTWLCGLKQL